MDDQRRLIMARTFKKLSQRDAADYGYMRGTRRRIHGENFGTNDEHDKYLSLTGDADPSRDAIGRGYLDGLSGVVPIGREG